MSMTQWCVVIIIMSPIDRTYNLRDVLTEAHPDSVLHKKKGTKQYVYKLLQSKSQNTLKY